MLLFSVPPGGKLFLLWKLGANGLGPQPFQACGRFPLSKYFLFYPCFQLLETAFSYMLLVEKKSYSEFS